MMRREAGRVVIEITPDEYSGLLVLLGYAIGSAEDRGEDAASWWRLANAINEGNPDYTPYAIPPPPAARRR
jgi:hypothetical protein